MKKFIAILSIMFGWTFAQCYLPCQTCVSGYVVMYPGTYVPNVCSNPCCCNYCYDCSPTCCECYQGCIYGPLNCPTCGYSYPPQTVINQMINN